MFRWINSLNYFWYTAILGFILVVLNSFLILMGVHRVHGCEEHGLPVLLRLTSWNRSALDDGVHVVSVPDVVDMHSAKSPGNSTLSCNVGSTRVRPECPWIARKISEMFGRIRVQAVLKPFLLSSSFCQETCPNLNWPVQGGRKPWRKQFCQDVSLLLDKLNRQVAVTWP